MSVWMMAKIYVHASTDFELRAAESGWGLPRRPKDFRDGLAGVLQ